MKERILYFLKMNFGFTKRESRGFLLVFPFLLLLYLIPLFLDNWIQHQNRKDYDSWVDELYSGILEISSTDTLNQKQRLPENEEPIAIDEERKAVLKVQYQEKTRAIVKPKPTGIDQLAFAEADSILLQVVPGIGPILAGRIIKYRDGLGGFYDQGQILEVYGLNEELAGKVYSYFPFSPLVFRKLGINELSPAELAKHPYINFGQAKVIVAFREQHGLYQIPEDLLKIKILNQDYVDKIKPYLFFEMNVQR